MMNRSFPKTIAASAFLLAMAAATPLMAADALPKAETILDKYIEVTGGKAAYEKIHNEMSTGTMEFAANGISGTLTSWHAEPDKVLVEIEIAAIGKMREGYDGTVGWSLSAVQGPHLKEGGEKAEAALQARFNSDLHWRELYPKAETTGVETIDGKECYKVVLTPKTGNATTRYYDKQTNLLVKASTTAKTAMGEIPVESVVADYRKEGDILMPHKVSQKAAGQEFSMTVTKVQYNVEIPKDKFELPDEIKALVNKK